jgi:hypothetical protein
LEDRICVGIECGKIEGVSNLTGKIKQERSKNLLTYEDRVGSTRKYGEYILFTKDH